MIRLPTRREWRALGHDLDRAAHRFLRRQLVTPKLENVAGGTGVALFWCFFALVVFYGATQ